MHEVSNGYNCTVHLSRNICQYTLYCFTTIRIFKLYLTVVVQYMRENCTMFIWYFYTRVYALLHSSPSSSNHPPCLASRLKQAPESQNPCARKRNKHIQKKNNTPLSALVLFGCIANYHLNLIFPLTIRAQLVSIVDVWSFTAKLLGKLWIFVIQNARMILSMMLLTCTRCDNLENNPRLATNLNIVIRTRTSNGKTCWSGVLVLQAYWWWQFIDARRTGVCDMLDG